MKYKIKQERTRKIQKMKNTSKNKLQRKSRKAYRIYKKEIPRKFWNTKRISQKEVTRKEKKCDKVENILQQVKQEFNYEKYHILTAESNEGF